MASKLLIPIIIVIAAVAVGAFFLLNSSSDENTGVPTDDQTGQQGNQTGNESGGTQPAGQPSITEYSLEADDDGFYMNGVDTPSISANLGEHLKLTFNVRTTNVYYAGLDFRGCGFNTGKVNPGSSTTVEFNVEDACTITSYWPSSGVVKDRLQISIS